jgi:hypothetical protein
MRCGGAGGSGGGCGCVRWGLGEMWSVRSRVC